MALDKYRFNPGDKLPAVNIDSIDPDNIYNQTAGYLTGGTNVSAISIFQTLADGSNDGKFKANIDGVVYDNIGIDLSSGPTPVTKIDCLNSSGYLSLQGQSFTPDVDYYITSITIRVGTTYSLSLTLRLGENIAGTILGTTNSVAGGVSGAEVTYSFPAPILLTAGQIYSFFYAGDVLTYDTYSHYAGGRCYRGGAWDANYDMAFSVKGFTPAEYYSYVAGLVQASIRTATGKTETVVWSIDHFVITSSTSNRSSKILKLTTPSTGTDISGAGDVPYLDMANNAVETWGTGEEYHLLRLGSDGKLPQGLTQPFQNITTTVKSLNTIYQNTTSTTKLIIVSMVIQGASNQTIDVWGLIGSSDNPSIVMSHLKDEGSSQTEKMTLPLFFIVPAGWYYKIATSGSYNSTPAIANWFECDFL